MDLERIPKRKISRERPRPGQGRGAGGDRGCRVNAPTVAGTGGCHQGGTQTISFYSYEVEQNHYFDRGRVRNQMVSSMLFPVVCKRHRYRIPARFILPKGTCTPTTPQSLSCSPHIPPRRGGRWLLPVQGPLFGRPGCRFSPRSLQAPPSGLGRGGRSRPRLEAARPRLGRVSQVGRDPRCSRSPTLRRGSW